MEKETQIHGEQRAPTLRWRGRFSAVNFRLMKMPGRILLPAAMAALAASSLAQQSPGLSAKPSGRTLAAPDAPPAEQPVDLTRSNPRTVIDSASGEELYFDAAMRGEAWAQTKLGKAYLVQSDNPERQQEGIELLKQAAAQKDAEAVYLLANMAVAGLGGQPSNIAALEKLQEAAELGNAEAQYELASMHAEGRGLPKDADLALLWGKKAADQGHLKAQFSVGRTLVERSDPEQKAQGLEYLRHAVTAKDSTAAIFLATVLARGEFGLEKQEKEAEEILRPLADAGDAEVQFALANFYRISQTIPGHQSLAMTWLRKAADQGHEKAIEAMATSRRE